MGYSAAVLQELSAILRSHVLNALIAATAAVLVTSLRGSVLLPVPPTKIVLVERCAQERFAA